MHVHRIRCDNCNREVNDQRFGRRIWAPSGWFYVVGRFDVDGDPDDEHHLCSHECLVAWSENMKRRADGALGTDLLPVSA